MERETLTQPKKILVIDDELGPRESLRFLFKNTYHVFCDESVEHGIETLRSESPDVVVMDIKMPGQNGMDGLREIRRLDPDVSVIMLTGFGSIESAQQAMRLGANDYVRKPFDTNEMRKTIKKYIAATEAARSRSRLTHRLQEVNQRLQQEIAETRTMATLGQASSALVHDLRNPLTVVCGYVQLLMSDMESPKEWTAERMQDALGYMDVIARNVQRCQEMSHMWKNLGKRDPSTFEICRAADIIEEVARNSRPLANEAGVFLDVVQGPAAAAVPADPTQLYRAMQNIVGNAVQAAPRGNGKVTVGWESSDDEVTFWIADNGPGIPEQDMNRAFEPGFTTRARTGGSGLGLFITRQIIEGTHGGRIELANRPEGGLRVTVRLPTETEPARPETP